MDRHIPLQGVDNFRDFGGYGTACGRGLQRGRLFRSGAHHQATDEDLVALARLGLKVIVDLRRSDERSKSPSRRWEGCEAQVLANDLGNPAESWERMLAGQDPTPAFFHQMHLDWYRKAPFQERLIDLYSRFFAALAETGGPVLIHCSAGKDRTGLLAALTQLAAGVHRDDVMADFLLTNSCVRAEVRGPVIAKVVERATGKVPTEEAVRIAMGVREDYLDAALAVIAERYGSVETYLAGPLGLDPQRRAAFEEKLLGEAMQPA